MTTLSLLLLCVLPQDQIAEARKLLNALAPAAKDSVHSQIEWESGASKGIGYFKRGQAWRVEVTSGARGQITVWDGKELIQFMKSQNSFFRGRQESQLMLLSSGGVLAEIHYSGNADRLLKGSLKATVKKEKLDDTDCSHVTIFQKEQASEIELHVWIDADNACKRFQRKTKIQGKTSEQTFTYKVIDPPNITGETFAFSPPPDAKDLRGGDR